MPFHFRHAWQQLYRHPNFSLVVVVTLAVCIGANAAIFSVIRSVLLEPYPWPESNRILAVDNSYPAMGLASAGDAIPDYFDRKERVSGFADAALYSFSSYNLTVNDHAERFPVIRATPSLFSTLGVTPQIGRLFTEAEAQPGSDRFVVLSYAAWQRRFGGNASILGTTIQLDAKPYVIVGVMPENFYFPSPMFEAWVPFAFTPSDKADSERGHEYSRMIARLKPGASLASVQSELRLIQAQNAERLPAFRDFWKTSEFQGRAQTFLDSDVGGVRDMLWLIQGAVTIALLIGCANVAGLMLARAASRERELAIRQAIGADRSQLIHLLLAESLVLFTVGSLLGLLVADWCIGGLNTLGLNTLPRAAHVHLDGSIFAFTVLGAELAGVIFGGLPAWILSRRDGGQGLREAASHSTSGRRSQKLRQVLVVAEVALAIMLLSTATLLIKSFRQMQKQDAGLAPNGVITAAIQLGGANYKTEAALIGYHDRAVAALRSVPGVREAGAIDTLPFTDNDSGASYSSPEIVLPANAPLPHAHIRSADAGYRSALGLRLVEGRWFDDRDGPAAPKAVVVDQRLVDRYWPKQSPLGRHIHFNGFNSQTLWTIVGVVEPVKVRRLDESDREETLYFPITQLVSPALNFVVNTDGDPAALAPTVRRVLQSIDPDQSVFDLRLMSDRMDEAARSRRAPMLLLSLFSGVALLLAALGLYGVLAFSVAQRTPEFGVRIALGALPRDIVRLVLNQAVLLVAIGTVAGMSGYVAVSRIVGRLLFQLSSLDLSALAAAPIVLGAVALAASFIPVRRATRVDPIVALRAE